MKQILGQLLGQPVRLEHIFALAIILALLSLSLFSWVKAFIRKRRAIAQITTIIDTVSTGASGNADAVAHGEEVLRLMREHRLTFGQFRFTNAAHFKSAIEHSLKKQLAFRRDRYADARTECLVQSRFVKDAIASGSLSDKVAAIERQDVAQIKRIAAHEWHKKVHICYMGFKGIRLKSRRYKPTSYVKSEHILREAPIASMPAHA